MKSRKKSQAIKNLDKKVFNTSKVNLSGLGDLGEILSRLKNDYMKIIFEQMHKSNIECNQICVILFRSNDKRLDPRYINAAFLRRFVKPENEFQQVAMSLQGKPFIVKFLQKGSTDIPLKIKFLEDFNNSIMFAFTEVKDMIDVELVLLEGHNSPAFDYFRDVKFFCEYDPYEHGYIPLIYRSDVLKFKNIKDY